MVDQSEKAFRLLCRELGTDLAYTPMLHARLFNEVPVFRDLHFDPEPSGGGPLFAQFAGHDPATVLKAAKHVEGHADAIDLNFGCPQGIARKGRYGAFLLDEPDVMIALVERLAADLSIPVTVKLRLLPDRDASIALCKRLEEAGASALCLHGRTREQNKQFAGSADWEPIREVVGALGIPVIANGGIETRADVDACLEYTGAAAVMSSEALLENPALFCSNVHPVTGEYLDQSALGKPARRDRAIGTGGSPCPCPCPCYRSRARALSPFAPD
jgi:tRNA-dihydrouridine synthase 1